ncbi:hypothetical protein [Mariniluteicoccus flavus]
MRNFTRTIAAIGTAAALAGGAAATQANAATDYLQQESFRQAGFHMEGHSSSTISSEITVSEASNAKMIDLVPNVSAAKAFPGRDGDTGTYYQAKAATAEQATADYRRIDAELERGEQGAEGWPGYQNGWVVRGTNGGEATIRVRPDGQGTPAGARITGHNGVHSFNLLVESKHGSTPQQLKDLAQSALNDSK